MANKHHGADGKFVQPYRARTKVITNRALAQMVREIGEEVLDEVTGMTRIQALIRTIYADGIAGKTDAAKVILERGWGKVPTPVKIDLRSEIEALLEEAGLTLTEASADPVLGQVLEHRVVKAESVGQSSD